MTRSVVQCHNPWMWCKFDFSILDVPLWYEFVTWGKRLINSFIVGRSKKMKTSMGNWKQMVLTKLSTLHSTFLNITYIRPYQRNGDQHIFKCEIKSYRHAMHFITYAVYNTHTKFNRKLMNAKIWLHHSLVAFWQPSKLLRSTRWRLVFEPEKLSSLVFDQLS